MLVVFPLNFVVDIKLIYGYNFVAPLKYVKAKKKKCLNHLLYADVIIIFVTRKCQKSPKND